MYIYHHKGEPEFAANLAAAIDDEGACEHVLKDRTLAVIVIEERDGFGTVGMIAHCEPCWKKCQQEQQEEEVECADCGEWFPRKTMRAWKGFDFNPAEGDEEIHICATCLKGDRHKKRVVGNKKAMEAYWEAEF